jgi:predicted HTH domain antitoxin
MSAATFEVRISAELLGYGFQPDDIQNQVTEWLVLSLFKDGRVSSRKAARLLGLTRVEFLALLRRRGMAYLDFSPAELAEEFAAAKLLPVEARP